MNKDTCENYMEEAEKCADCGLWDGGKRKEMPGCYEEPSLIALCEKYMIKTRTAKKMELELKETEELQKNLKIPEYFENLETAMELQEERREIQNMIDDTLKQLRERRENLKKLMGTICGRLPFSNKYVKMRFLTQNMVAYGVGYYRDEWGGTHDVLVIKPWPEDDDLSKLPSLNDRRDYR